MPSQVKIVLDQIVVKSQTLLAALRHRIGNNDKALLIDRHSWFPAQLRTAFRASVPRHPLQAAQRFVPTNLPSSSSSGHPPRSKQQQQVAICRYHNYHPQGCAKHRDRLCPHDHEHCHLCLAAGHVARDCDWIQ